MDLAWQPARSASRSRLGQDSQRHACRCAGLTAALAMTVSALLQRGSLRSAAAIAVITLRTVNADEVVERAEERQLSEDGKVEPQTTLEPLSLQKHDASSDAALASEVANETPPLLSSYRLSQQPQCWYGGAIEEKSDDDLKELLSEELCPFLAAFFSGASPLARSDALVEMEQQVAAAFPEIRYYRVDADHLSMRAFLQWDIAFLPTYVLYTPPESLGHPGTWYRWKGSGTNPYDFHTVAGFIQRTSGLRPSNSSTCVRLAGAWEALPRRGSESWTGMYLAMSWVLVVVAALQRWFGQPLGDV